MNNLGFVHERGHGVPQDYAKARHWYEGRLPWGSKKQ
jgi:TPR repeat protein